MAQKFITLGVVTYVEDAVDPKKCLIILYSTVYSVLLHGKKQTSVRY
jgi:hypothetical protein